MEVGKHLAQGAWCLRLGWGWTLGLDSAQGPFLCLSCSSLPTVRDRLRTKIERDILADVNHPFVVKLHYGECSSLGCWERGCSCSRLWLPLNTMP